MLRDVARRFAARIHSDDYLGSNDDVLDWGEFYAGMGVACRILAEEFKNADPSFSDQDFLVLCGFETAILRKDNK